MFCQVHDDCGAASVRREPQSAIDVMRVSRAASPAARLSSFMYRHLWAKVFTLTVPESLQNLKRKGMLMKGCRLPITDNALFTIRNSQSAIPRESALRESAHPAERVILHRKQFLYEVEHSGRGSKLKVLSPSRQFVAHLQLIR